MIQGGAYAALESPNSSPFNLQGKQTWSAQFQDVMRTLEVNDKAPR
jgi:hypothetical protein